MEKILVVTHNAHKISEFQEILTDYQVLGLHDLGIQVDIEETGTTYEENARIKVNAVNVDDMIVVADDSGIEIEALNNQPGILSARFLGEDTPYDIKNQQVLEMLADIKNRKAHYQCCVVAKINGEEHSFFGTLDGEIAYQAKGKAGFGYDPIFYLPQYQKTTAELGDDFKNKISHRYQALQALSKFLKGQ